jgi:hypothetical protein
VQNVKAHVVASMGDMLIAESELKIPKWALLNSQDILLEPLSSACRREQAVQMMCKRDIWADSSREIIAPHMQSAVKSGKHPPN